MIRPVCRDPILLAGKSAPIPAGAVPSAEDLACADDLTDTLRAEAERCVGMAANMIGIKKRIIVFSDGGKLTEMFEPELVKTVGPYETEEGCLSLDGVRKTRRYREIRVRWMTRTGAVRVRSFSGFTAEIIQHEIDHLNGILI